MPPQGRGADPGKVIERMGQQLGEQAKQLAVASVMIESLEEEIAVLRAQQTDSTT